MQQPATLSMNEVGVGADVVMRNAPPAVLYEEAIAYEQGTAIAANGALICNSGERTGRSPKDKRIVEHPDSSPSVWWGEINIPLDEQTFLINRERAIDYLHTRKRRYVVDGFAGWDPEHRLKVRVVGSRAYHALFMHNMLVRATPAELESFGDPDLTIYNAGKFPANKYTRNMTSGTSVDVSLERGEIVILGTEYAGEMKKGVFTVMNYLMPGRGVLSMHCSANEGAEGDVSLFFGLSGTGKTTLSADTRRRLIGDDEHCWTDTGVFNIEGGCYAKCVDLSPQSEPDIYKAIRFGAVLENVRHDPTSRDVDYTDRSYTENTRAAYPIDHMENAKIPCVGGHPKNIIFLTADAFGVLPPVSRLSPEDAMYHFLSGYTAKIAGTEEGVKEPQATFSACFGAAFLVRHPKVYGDLLAERIRKHRAKAWLVNTGWTGGGYGVGSRIKLGYTRAIIDAIHSGALDDAPTERHPAFGLEMVTGCPGVPSELLSPRQAWEDGAAYDTAARRLAGLFDDNFRLIDGR
jgi:phosphoenolpyruvate carboxykinase (ATP)